MFFVLGLLIGLLSAIGLFGGAAYWLCTRSNHVAIAKFINGIAQALAHRPDSAGPMSSGSNGAAGATEKRGRGT